MLRVHTALLLIALVAAGCGSNHGSGNNTSGSGAVVTLTIGSDVTVAKGRTHQFQAQFAHDGSLDDCTATGQWTSSDPAVASVSGGAATALGLGQTTITASCSGSTDSATLVVTPAEAVAIAVTPATGELPVGFSEQLTAIATLTDATTADVTADVVWNSSNTSAFTVSNDVATPGVITAQPSVGQSSNISASHAASGQVATVTRTVTDATLQAIAVKASADSPIAFDPLAPSVPSGVDVQFHATGTFSDGKSNDVTPTVTWASNNTSVASFATQPGLAATGATGSAKISATHGAVAAPPATLTVTAPVVISVAIDQDGATLTVGETLQLTGTATFTDDNTQNATLTGWTSSVPGVASVSATGFLTAVAEGSATISASYTTADGRTLTDSTQVTVVAPTSAPILSYLTLTPGSVKGGKKAVKGTVVLTAPATQDTVVTLTSSAPSLVTPPGSVTILSGSTTAQFSIPTSHPSKTQKVKITAALDGASKVATLNLRR
jgi:uncharacterized protein YjdB